MCFERLALDRRVSKVKYTPLQTAHLQHYRGRLGALCIELLLLETSLSLVGSRQGAGQTGTKQPRGQHFSTLFKILKGALLVDEKVVVLFYLCPPVTADFGMRHDLPVHPKIGRCSVALHVTVSVR
jgi:hypothetical protein